MEIDPGGNRMRIAFPAAALTDAQGVAVVDTMVEATMPRSLATALGMPIPATGVIDADSRRRHDHDAPDAVGDAATIGAAVKPGTTALSRFGGHGRRDGGSDRQCGQQEFFHKLPPDVIDAGCAASCRLQRRKTPFPSRFGKKTLFFMSKSATDVPLS